MAVGYSFQGLALELLMRSAGASCATEAFR